MLVLVPALPLAAALLTAVLGPRVLRHHAHWPALLATLAAGVLSVLLLQHVQQQLDAGASPAARLQASGADAPREPSSEPLRPAGFEETVTLWTWAIVPEARPAIARPANAPSAGGTPAGDGAAATSPSGATPAETATAATAFRIAVTLRLDSLTAIMFVTVTLIATLVVWYSSAYMHGDRGYWRFFTYVSLFVFSMLMLVCVSNFLLLYVFWEAVGVCSYLLIGFWYHKPEAAAAGQKAFLVNRVGDFGFALGVFLLWSALGTLDFHDTPAADGSAAAPGVLGPTVVAEGYQAAFPGVTPSVLLAAALLLFLGACGKSAQVPLHVWLPDAMEGPTPVSALIHAATMVTAGVYLVARCTPLFAAGTGAHVVVACIGGLTALLAGVVALTQTDLKRILAYSTVSQLGYMFLALGTGSLAGIVAAMFHLFTHAFFKACLFLGAGSVMHAMGGVIDIRHFGGLRRLLPVTHATFLVASLALAGVVPLSGFWSKDAILGAVHDAARGGGSVSWLFAVLYYSALFAAFLTALYSFRALFLTFYGPQRVPPEAGHHAHESPPTMTLPLLVLAAGSAAIALVAPWFRRFLAGTTSLASAGAAHGATSTATFHWDVALGSTAAALLGIGLAALLYLRPTSLLPQLTAWMRCVGLYQASAGKLFFDAVYAACITWPLIILAYLCYFIDKIVIDGLVNLLGWIPRAVGGMLRPMQMGLIPFYALAMILGLLVLIGSLLRWPSG
jgi:NADH-quinone oxidoreductase subunit L